MYFVYRDGKYIDAAGLSFRDFLAGRLSVLPGEKPKLGDWKDHLSTAFPEVRLKGYLEMRGADGGRWDRICALPAFWVGLLYDDIALDAAWELVKGWSHADHDRLRTEVPRLGLQAASPNGGTLQDLARTVLDIADKGLARRARLNKMGDTEQGFLNPLREIAESGLTNADRMLALYSGEWGGDVSRIYAAESY
jgi:glutamate--cysteine ligase